MKSLSFVVCLMAVLAGVYFLTIEQDAPISLYANHLQAIYVTDADDLPVRVREFVEKGVTIVDDVDDGEQFVAASIIYIHPDMLSKLPVEVLRDAFNNQAVIVAFNTPLSVLSHTLDYHHFSIDDLREDFLADNPTYATAAMVRSYNGVGTIGHWTYYDFFKPEDFNMIFGIAENQLVAE